jgi:hypothetical protein
MPDRVQRPAWHHVLTVLMGLWPPAAASTFWSSAGALMPGPADEAGSSALRQMGDGAGELDIVADLQAAG